MSDLAIIAIDSQARVISMELMTPSNPIIPTQVNEAGHFVFCALPGIHKVAIGDTWNGALPPEAAKFIKRVENPMCYAISFFHGKKGYRDKVIAIGTLDNITLITKVHHELTYGKEGIGIFNENHYLIDYLSSIGGEEEPLHTDGQLAQLLGSEIIIAAMDNNPKLPVPQWILDRHRILQRSLE